MAAIHLRQDKERPLTIEEVDENFDSINREVAEKLDSTSFSAVNILAVLENNAGAGSTLDADKVHGFYPSSISSPSTVAIRDALSNLYANQFYGVHVGAVLGNVTGNVVGTVTGNATNVDGVVQIEHGGTGATGATAARTNLGLGSMATQNKTAVDVTGGTITGITDLAVADGGTGASNASSARTNLGLVIGADIQAYHATLTGLSATTGNGFLVRKTDNSAVVRKFVAGNSLEITNVDGTAGDITFALTLNPTVSSVIKSGTNGTGDIGQSANRFNVIYGRSTSATYADLAEKYTTKETYEPGTVVAICEDADHDVEASWEVGQDVVGVVSTAPAFVMNDESNGQAIGLKGRVPVKVSGPIKKGEAICANVGGTAIKCNTRWMAFGNALETNLDEGVKLVECFIK
jgi:hypothetical protein